MTGLPTEECYSRNKNERNEQMKQYRIVKTNVQMSTLRLCSGQECSNVQTIIILDQAQRTELITPPMRCLHAEMYLSNNSQNDCNC